MKKNKEDNKENKIHKFEEDLAIFTKLKEESGPMLRLFFKHYEEFEKVSKMDGMAFRNPEKVINFILNNSEKIKEMFSIIAAATKFSYDNLNYTISDFCVKTGADVKKFSVIKNKEDIIDLTKSIIMRTHYNVLQNKKATNRIEIYTYIICATIKFYLDDYAKMLKSHKAYLDETYGTFKKYCNLIMERKNISDSLIDKIICFINSDIYGMKVDNQKNKEVSKEETEIDKTKRKQDYIKEFREYTKNYNSMVEKDKLRVVTPTNFAVPVKNKPSHNPISYVTDEIINEKKQIEDNAKKKEQEEIDKWVSSFLDVICALDDASNLKSQLPPPYLKNYDKIMELLLSGFDEKCKEKGKTTMNDVAIYTQLQYVVESLKK